MDGLTEKFKQFKSFSETNKQYVSGIMNQSPLTRTKIEIENQILKAERYRVSVLQNVVAFKGMTQESLSSAAQILEEVYYKKDDKIICQDDFGDTFYILEEGMVSIRRKMNVHDTNEMDKELAIRGKDFHFGDVALLTGEPRSATIVVISETAKCLRMNKTKFDDISSAAKKLMATNRNLICRGAVDKLPFFNILSKKNKTRLVETMIEVNYIAGTYIHRQGTIDNAFHIITEGECIVTINSDDTQERELKTLCPGDYFGEKSLTDSSTALIKRAYNFIAKTSVTCVVLSNADYSYYVGQDDNIGMSDNFKRMLANSGGNNTTNNPMNTTTNNNSNGKHDDKKYDNTLNMLKLKNAHRRRVTIYDNNGQPSTQRAASILRRYAKFSTEALFVSLYARMFRDLKLIPEHIELYGKISSNIMAKNLTCRKTIEEIRYQATRALSTDRSRRSHADISFISGLLSQKNMLKDIYCFNWPPYQFTELCKKITFMQIPSLSKIVEVGNKGTSAYLIMRGAVRIFTKCQGTERTLHYEEDLCSGQMFAEDSLNGQRTILITAQALTPVDLVVIDCEDYTGAQEKSAMKMTIEDRYQFLANIPHFKHCEPVHLFTIAHKLLQKECEKNIIIVNKGDNSISSLYFLVEGRLDVIGSTKHHANPRAVTSVQKYGMFGEIGILNSRLTAKQLKQSKSRLHEEFDYICVTKIKYFELPVDVFHHFDEESYLQIKKACMTKSLWRKGRYYDIRMRETNKLLLPINSSSSLRNLVYNNNNNNNNNNGGNDDDDGGDNSNTNNRSCNSSNNNNGGNERNWYDIPTTNDDDDDDDNGTTKNTSQPHPNAAYHPLINHDDDDDDQQQYDNNKHTNTTTTPNNNNNTTNKRNVGIDYTLPIIHTATTTTNTLRKSSSLYPSSSSSSSSSSPNNFFINSEQVKLNSLLSLQSSNISNPLMVLTTCKTPLQTQRTLAYIRSAQKLLLPQLSHESLSEQEFTNTANNNNSNSSNSNGSSSNTNNSNNNANNDSHISNNDDNVNNSNTPNTNTNTNNTNNTSDDTHKVEKQYKFMRSNHHHMQKAMNDSNNSNHNRMHDEGDNHYNNTSSSINNHDNRNSNNNNNKYSSSNNSSSNNNNNNNANHMHKASTVTMVRPVSSHALQRWNEYQQLQQHECEPHKDLVNNHHNHSHTHHHHHSSGSSSSSSSNINSNINNNNSHSKSMNALPLLTVSSSSAAVTGGSGGGISSSRSDTEGVNVHSTTHNSNTNTNHSINNNANNSSNHHHHTTTTTTTATNTTASDGVILQHDLKTSKMATQYTAAAVAHHHNHNYYNDDDDDDDDDTNKAITINNNNNNTRRHNSTINSNINSTISSTMMLRGSNSLPSGITLAHFLN